MIAWLRKFLLLTLMWPGLLPALGASGAVLLRTSVVRATGKVGPIIPAAVERSLTRRKEGEFPEWINYSDCLNDLEIIFSLDLEDPSDGDLEVWVGTGDCTDDEEREGTTPDCWKVYSERHFDTDVDVTIRAQDVVAAKRENNPDSDTPATAADCDSDDAPTNQTIKFYFMKVNGKNYIDGSAATWDSTQVDMDGPSPPDDLRAGVGENSVVLKWTGNNDDDRVGVAFFCAEAGDPAVPVSDGTVGAGGAASTGAAGGGAGSGGDGAAELAMSSADASVPATDAGVDAMLVGDAGLLAEEPEGMTNPECPSLLLEGARPGADVLSLRCGKTGSIGGDGTTDNKLENGRLYAVAVAGIDAVGNHGPLSNIVCATPEEVTDFFEDYRASGGKGGGGFCSVIPGLAKVRENAGFAAALVLLGLAGYGRRRTRRGAARNPAKGSN